MTDEDLEEMREIEQRMVSRENRRDEIRRDLARCRDTLWNCAVELYSSLRRAERQAQELQREVRRLDTDIGFDREEFDILARRAA